MQVLIINRCVGKVRGCAACAIHQFVLMLRGDSFAHFILLVYMHSLITLPAAPPKQSIQFECDNGRLRLNVTLVADPSSTVIEPIDIDLASIGISPTTILPHNPQNANYNNTNTN